MSDSKDLQYVIDQQKNRLTVLSFIWESTRHNVVSESGMGMKEVGEGTSLDKDDLVVALKYLHEENLIKAIVQDTFESWFCRISHLGILEREATITKPTKDTSHFLSDIIVYAYTKNNITAGRDAIGNIIDSEIDAPVSVAVAA